MGSIVRATPIIRGGFLTIKSSMLRHTLAKGLVATFCRRTRIWCSWNSHIRLSM